MKTARRLRSETYSCELLNGKYVVQITVCRDAHGAVAELVFTGRGKIGTEIDQLLMDLGVGCSRAICGRDPTTGVEVK